MWAPSPPPIHILHSYLWSLTARPFKGNLGHRTPPNHPQRLCIGPLPISSPLYLEQLQSLFLNYHDFLVPEESSLADHMKVRGMPKEAIHHSCSADLIQSEQREGVAGQCVSHIKQPAGSRSPAAFPTPRQPRWQMSNTPGSRTIKDEVFKRKIVFFLLSKIKDILGNFLGHGARTGQHEGESKL